MKKAKVLTKHNRSGHLSYFETVRFHGHDGPFLALGYGLGRHLVRVLKPKHIMDLKIVVKTRFRKPYTCLLDGLQCATCATLGKGNLIVKDIPEGAIIVHAQKGRKIKKYTLTEPARQICFAAKNLQIAARRILRTPIKKLWQQLD